MKRQFKRILVQILALCLLLTLLPTTALATGATVKIGGIDLPVGKYLASDGTALQDSAPASGGYAYRSDAATLTLNNFTKSHTGTCINVSGNELTINLVGENKITSTSTEEGEYGVHSNANLTISDGDSGSLTVDGGIDGGEEFIIDGATVCGNSRITTARSGTLRIQNSSDVTVNDCSAHEIDVYGSKLTLTAGDLALSGNGDFAGSTVIIENGGIYSDSKAELDVFESTLSVTTGSTEASIDLGGKKLSVASDSRVTTNNEIRASSVSIEAGSTVGDANHRAPITASRGDITITASNSDGSSGRSTVISGRISAEQNVTITGSTVDALATEDLYSSIYAKKNVTIEVRSEVTATATGADSTGITALESLTISGSTVTATANGSGTCYGIQLPDGTGAFTLSGGEVTATGTTAGVRSDNTTVTGGTLTAYGANAFSASREVPLTIGPAGTDKAIVYRGSATPGETDWSAAPNVAVFEGAKFHFARADALFSSPSVRISEAWAIDGTVMDESDTPVEGFALSLDGIRADNYYLSLVPAGAYRLYAEHGTHTIAAEKDGLRGEIDVTVSGAPLTGQDIVLRAPAPVTIAGLPMAESSYYVNGANGTVGTVTDTEPADWNAKLELVDGKYKLTIKDLRLSAENNKNGITSNVDLELHLGAGETTNDSYIAIKSGTASAVDVKGDLLITNENALHGLAAYSYGGDAVSVTGNLTYDSDALFQVFTFQAGCAGVKVGGDLLLEPGSFNFNAMAAPNCNADSRGAKVGGDVVMNGKSLSAIANDSSGIGLEASGSIQLCSGSIDLQGGTRAVNREPDLSAHPAYIYSTDSGNSFSNMLYAYDEADTCIVIRDLPSATISDVALSGTAKTAIAPVDATITLTVERFSSDMAAGDDVSGWFTNLPAGITAKVKEMIPDIFHSPVAAVVTFSGTPTEKCAEPMTVTIPAEKLFFGLDLTVTANADARWDIAPARSGSSYADFTITATAGAGGTISPSGAVPVREGRAQSFAITPSSGYAVVDVLVDGVSVGAVREYRFADVQKRHRIEVIFAQETLQSVFSDVAERDWFFEDVMFAYRNGLMTGVSGTSFDPHGTTTRGMIVEILYRLEGRPAAAGACPFGDVKAGSYYERAVIWAAANGIVDGYNAGTFGPNDPITREQLAAILYRYEQYKGGGFTGAWMFPLDFTDADTVSSWAYEAMCWCTMNKIISGSNGALNPQGNAERCQVAATLRRLLG